MVETRRTASAKIKAKSTASTRQRTLFEFSSNAAPATEPLVQPVEAAQDHSSELNVHSQTTPAVEEEDRSVDPVVEKLRQASLEPRPLHPFFSQSKSTPSLPPPISETRKPAPATIIEIADDETASEEIMSSKPNPLPEVSGSQEDPIVLDSSPLKPLRRQKANASKDSRPIASLFAPRIPRVAPVSSTSQSPEIVVLEPPDQPVKPKKLASLFARRHPKVLPAQPNSHGVSSKEMDAPFPDIGSQHVRGPQCVYSAPGLPFNRRVERHSSSSTSNITYEPGSLKSLFAEKIDSSSTSPTESTPSDPSIYLDTLPYEDRQHPALTRFITTSQPEAATHQLWVDKWRPTRAEEILGNEENAMYLRDWIHTLELQIQAPELENTIDFKGKGKARAEPSRGTKRPRVVRKVEKKRGKKKRRVDSDDDDDWIVYTDDNFSSAASSPPPFDIPSSPQRSSPPPQLAPITELGVQIQPSLRYIFEPLMNTILLVGPSGSGKTAAVYACAEELGWDVLEVYPGIGKRNGPGVESLIGDAGKNHHVRKMRNADVSATSEALNSLFNESNNSRTSTPQGYKGVEPALANLGLSSIRTPHSVRQSLILLEEVDILFKEDTSFWPAVTNFIKECRRPVICTCNGMCAFHNDKLSSRGLICNCHIDISLIPTQDLPLQTILTFQPCRPPLAASYLQALCFSEGHHMFQRDALLRMYEASAPTRDAIDTPDIPNPAISGDLFTPDLRRTINNLQFLCTSASKSGPASGWEHGEQYTVDKMCDWDGVWEDDWMKGPKSVSADQGVTATVMRAEAPLRDFVLAARQADVVSFVDTYLIRGPWDTQEASRVCYN
ncbi:hypothetical protein H0H87_009056 [Tephrocybe sp. NHM501043]|nr:hypothetical protein H0H87_009056 [Tephrocybe sp. NHM501043]